VAKPKKKKKLFNIALIKVKKKSLCSEPQISRIYTNVKKLSDFVSSNFLLEQTWKKHLCISDNEKMKKRFLVLHKARSKEECFGLIYATNQPAAGRLTNLH
jgi:hypothetical protein